jgi:hypothetical protein
MGNSTDVRVNLDPKEKIPPAQNFSALQWSIFLQQVHSAPEAQGEIITLLFPQRSQVERYVVTWCPLQGCVVQKKSR